MNARFTGFKQKECVIFYEGNIGCGKSTLGELLEGICRDENGKKIFNVIPEPIDMWTTKFVDSETGKNILELLYEDPKKWGFAFQMMTYTTRIRAIQEKFVPGMPNFIERSIFSDRKVFAEQCLTGISKTIYDHSFDLIFEESQIPCDGFIYIKTDSEICQKRIQKRARSGEEDISLEYLKCLEKRHNDWLCDNKNYPVLILDGNQDIEERPSVCEDFYISICEFTDRVLNIKNNRLVKNIYKSGPSFDRTFSNEKLGSSYEN